MGCFPSSKRKRTASSQSITKQSAQSQGLSARYEVSGIIRKTPYSTVLAVVHKTSGTEYAAHTLRKEPVGKVPTSEAIKNREFSLISSLSHPNLTRMLEWLDTKLEYVFITESYTGENLYDKLSHTTFTEPQVKAIMRQVLSAVAYCHQKRIMHRDLSLDCIWLSQMNVKIALFGTLSFFDLAKKTTGRGGTAYYVAPEIMEGLYDEKCDIWSCGVMMHILLAGFAPFEGATELETAMKIRDELISFYEPAYSHVSNPAKNLLHRMLIKAPLQRITAQEALAHEWFATDPQKPITASECQELETKFRNFHMRSKLKDTLCTFIVTHVLREKDVQTARDLFLRMDKNGDGKLSAEEVRSALESEFGSFHEVANLKDIDSDGSGFVDYNEFLKVMVGKKEMGSSDTLKAAFALLDKDSSGYITSDELREMLLSTGVESLHARWDELLREVDSNGDQRLDISEFVNLLTRL